MRGGVLFKLMALRAPVDKTEVALRMHGCHSRCVNYITLLNRESIYFANSSLALGPSQMAGSLLIIPIKTEIRKADRGATGQNRSPSLGPFNYGWLRGWKMRPSGRIFV